MPNLNAALGCAQFHKLSDVLKSKKKLYASYNSAFSVINGCSVFSQPNNCSSNYWLQAIILNKHNNKKEIRF